MSEYCITCTTNKTSQFRSESKLRAKINFSYGPSSKLSSLSIVKPNNSVLSRISTKFSSSFGFNASYKLMHGPSLVQSKLTADISAKLQSSNNVRSKFISQSYIKDIKTDKFSGPVNLNNIKHIYNSIRQIGNTQQNSELFLLGYEYESFPLRKNDHNAWLQISVGYYGDHFVGINSSAKLFGWGANTSGEVGDGTLTSRISPVQISDDSWLSVSCGLAHSLAIRNDGKLFGWGNNQGGQLGTGDTNDRLAPTRIGNDSWVFVVAGLVFSAGINSNGKLFIWGSPALAGPFGNVPTQIGNDSWLSVSLGKGHILAIRQDRKLFGLGNNSWCQNIALGSSFASLVQINNSSWKDASCGELHSCAIREDGALFCWGANSVGQIGIDPSYKVCSPVQLMPGVKFKKVFCGPYNTFAIDINDNIICFGDNSFGQLGFGFTSNYEPPTYLDGYYANTISTSFFNTIILGDYELKNPNRIISGIEKLYPTKDIDISFNNYYFVNQEGSQNNLYSSIDGGVFIGDLTSNGGNSNIISDEEESYIQPSSIYTSGNFRYKCEVSSPMYTPKESFLFIRAAAPTSTLSSNIPPEYKIFNIRFEDPSGNLIIKYKDITVRGDSDYSKNKLNFVTYISEPEINNLSLYSWQDNYPLLGQASGYTLNLDFSIQCLDDPFSLGFNKGYEDTCKTELINTDSNSYLSFDGSPLSTQTQVFSLNPTNSIRISDIEIANSGNRGYTSNNLLNFYVEVNAVGNKLTRIIPPVELILNSEDLGIYPSGYSTWISTPDGLGNTYTNETKVGSRELANQIANDENYDYITLISSSPHQDSGRLTLRFSHQSPGSVVAYSDGEFSFGSLEFDRAALSNVPQVDNFFVVDEIELKIIAKKAVGSRDYALDIVGYSDDKLLNVTPKLGAFLQNLDHGVGTVPSISGFRGVGDLGLSSESISDQDQFFISPLVDIDAGDHYKLSTSPIISGTSFQEYTIPLKIYKNNVTLGEAKDYSSSSYFENLLFDIYPLPSGAAIASARLIVKYKPSNALAIHTLAHAADNESTIRDMRLLPVGPKNTNDLLDLCGSSGNYSLVTNIPHGFSNDSSLKTNYSRRWRGIDGNVANGPFNQNQFALFDYQNVQKLNPFLDGYFTFKNDSGNIILSESVVSSGISGILVGSYNKILNIGSRLVNSSLFDHSTPYRTIDWTTPGHELYGKIVDSYDNTLRLSGINSYINFGPLDTASGFALYVRFSPDKTISGVNYNYFDSGVIASKWNANNNLEFVLGYDDGYLSAKALDSSGNYIIISDPAHYSAYQYPLSVLLTYNDNLSKKLKLYTSNENNYLSSELRGSSQEFILSSGNNDLTIGYSKGSGIGINLFLTECGISRYNDLGSNITESGINKLYKQTTAKSWLDSNSFSFEQSVLNSKNNLWSYIDKNSDDWHLGEFGYCVFSADFDFFTTRIGQDFIVHTISSDGSPYYTKTNIAIPSGVNASGLSYHTQIENDFIRFNIADIPDNDDTSSFYSALPRITKSLPRGYSVADKAFVIDAIIEHDINSIVSWPDGKIGPKLILSLYNKNEERPGLINRSVHYLKPSGCINKIYGSFNLDSFFDNSESWANFDLNNNISEFNHKYFSEDLDNAFIQIDLAYPSGGPYNSTIKIHSINLRLEDAILQKSNSNNNLSLYSSGEKIWLDQLDLTIRGQDILSNSNNLFILSDNAPSASSIVNLFTNVDWTNEKLNLFIMNSGATNNAATLYVDGRFNQFKEESLPLVHISNFFDHFAFRIMPLYTKSTTGNTLFSGSMPMYVKSRLLVDTKRSEKFNLFLSTQDKILQSQASAMSCYINTDDIRTYANDIINLYTINYPAFNESFGQYGYITWNNTNPGKNIQVDDNIYASLAANDEIRGVELICYGSCVSSGTCGESTIKLHDATWLEQLCVDGGIIRPENVYTNLETSGFNSPVGYSGHFYGIRKYTGLIPNAQYSIIVTGRTGNNKSISLPRTIEDVGYGYFEDAQYSGIKINLNNQRQENDRFGKSVAVTKNIMAVGAPSHNLEYEYYNTSGQLVTENITEAGAIFIYNRESNPSGSNWTKSKGDWSFDSKIVLPSSLLLEHYNNSPKEIGPFTIYERFWETGQRGRKLGYSLDLAQSSGQDNRYILVAGGPGASWKTPESVSELESSNVSIGLLIFTDEFYPVYAVESDNLIPDSEGVITRTSFKSAEDIFNIMGDKDILFKYFSKPSIKFNVKIIVCESLSDVSDKVIYDINYPNVYKTTITRNQGFNANSEQVFDQIKNIFDQAFPYDSNEINNNIPVMLGVAVNNSRSFGRESIAPGLNSFINYYKNYSFLSGVKDFYGNAISGSVYEINNKNEVWIDQGVELLDSILNINRIIQDDQVKLFSSGIGLEFFDNSLAEFNRIPESGGRVYIFEKENNDWSLIQEIRSPETYNNDVCDRYGHSVSISKNAEVIAVGSPYIKEACQIYEYNPLEKPRLLRSLRSWIDYKNSSLGGSSVRYTTLMADYAKWISTYNTNTANSILYSSLNSNEKFEARQYLNIQEYKKIFTYSYEDIRMLGSYWLWIPESFAPFSRLGYSTAINEDGSVVAFGAPTDSMNKWDDGNIYYKNLGYAQPNDNEGLNSGPITGSWASNVNAGAVRLFESRKIYPHNSVVEFGKFGNLHRSLNDPLDSGHFNYLSSVFSDLNFSQTEFTDVKIPQNAGLVFIITPEVDALSDEVINNIVDWLSLGDRNLVLVGNDPVWENNGIYNKSNTIINKILQIVDSRIRLFPAKNSREALVSSIGSARPSYRPQYSTTSYINPSELPSYGVADIRFINISDDIADTLERMIAAGVFSSSNLKPSGCVLPFRNSMDLRAELFAECKNCENDPVIYPINLPYFFRNYDPVGCCGATDLLLREKRKNLPQQEPIPILAAATLNTIEIITPPTPPTSGFTYRYETVFGTRPASSGVSYSFDENNVSSGASFIFNNSAINENNFSFNIADSVSGIWYEPDSIDGRSGIIQSSAFTTVDNAITTEEIQPTTIYAAEDRLDKDSSIFVIAGTFTESEEILYSGDDNNINFYTNLVYSQLGSNIAQLGGWTGHNNFKSAFEDSILQEIFLNNGNNVDLNVQNINLTYDICWIANPLSVPSDDQIMEIKNWLSLGNRKLIITMGDTEEYDLNNRELIPISQRLSSQANIVKTILEKLESQIRPLFLNNKYIYDIASSYTNLLLNTDHYISRGRSVLTSINKFTISTEKTAGLPSKPINIFNQPIIPLVDGQSPPLLVSEFSYVKEIRGFQSFVSLSSTNIIPVVYTKRKITDTKIISLDPKWRFDTGLSKISIPIMPGSGYKIFITTVAENPYESQPINIFGTNFERDFDIFETFKNDSETLSFERAYQSGKTDANKLEDPRETNGFSIYNNRIYGIQYEDSRRANNIIGKPSTVSFNAWVPTKYREPFPLGSPPPTSIDFYFYNNSSLSLVGINYIPKTVRLLAISGCLIGFKETIKYEEEKLLSYTVPIEDTLIQTSSGTPGSSRIETFYGTIVNEGTVCAPCCSGNIVADGPVIAAQEIEHITPFKYGINRSRITVLSDSSLIQGRYAGDESRKLSSNSVNFIRSLYPFTNFNTNHSGRNFNVTNKLVAPDRGSPAKYKSIVDNSGINIRFGGSINSTAKSFLTDKDSRYDPLYVTRPENEPWGGGSNASIINEIKRMEKSIFAYSYAYYGSSSMFSGILNNKIYSDISMVQAGYGSRGAIPEIMRDTGYDYLDFEAYPSGYPGDLFGYSIALSNNKLIVGAPFNAFTGEDMPNWDYYIDSNGSGVELSYNGGAGAVYIFENIIGESDDSWECVQKLRPESINVDASGINDQFGYDVDIDSDTIIVGAPGHDFGNIVVDGSGAFVRKFFNAEFNIRPRIVIDVSNSGNYTKDIGACFVYDNQFIDWSTKKLAFNLVEKIAPNTIYDSGNLFGESVSLYRSKRTDSDYTIGIGSSFDSYSSGEFINSAGSVSSYDLMIREQPPSIPNSGAWIKASIFGDMDENKSPKTEIFFYNSGESVLYNTDGTVYTNNQGEIFIEVSGQDSSQYGFVQQRPYIESVDGQIVYGINNSGSLPLFIEGERFVSSNMNMFANVQDVGNVYNSLGLYNGAVMDIISGPISGINLYVRSPDPTVVSNSGLNLFVSGVGVIPNNMITYIRGI